MHSSVLVVGMMIVHFIEHHVADSYSSMVQAAQEGFVHREDHRHHGHMPKHRLFNNAAEVGSSSKSFCVGVSFQDGPNSFTRFLVL